MDIQIDDRDGLFRYQRTCNGERVEKYLVGGYNAIHIHPVEPVNLPKEITHYLEISFPAIVVPPAKNRQVFLKFPVEFGVFFELNGEMNILDIFSFAPSKYSLYGTPSAGYITRWYQSGIYTELPETDMKREGVLDLTIMNRSSSAVEVARAVFDSHYMNIFYGDHVGMTAMMTVISPVIAETTFSSAPPKGCTNKSIDLYLAKKFVVGQSKGFLMDAGIE